MLFRRQSTAGTCAARWIVRYLVQGSWYRLFSFNFYAYSRWYFLIVKYLVRNTAADDTTVILLYDVSEHYTMGDTLPHRI